ncbi:5-oxoprolinase-like isoform X2 [Clavelina lepadiformis]|uniref:5-oxoprolinase-like isoform X2 n=1 Tax=Clavelina lepadiformis TaxID=159417 RepID=UPI004041778F
MQDAVHYQMMAIEINEGDAGGVHLPDFTGIHPFLEFMSSCGLEVVQAYLAHIQHHAEVAVGNVLRDVSMTTDGVLHASDKMDDG